MFQSTSSEEDVVSAIKGAGTTHCFNPRPPKRTLCRPAATLCSGAYFVSIHVLRRGRCVLGSLSKTTSQITSFNPRPPKRTLCPAGYHKNEHNTYVSIHVLRRGRCVDGAVDFGSQVANGFNPRPPKRTLCLQGVSHFAKLGHVSIHVLRRGRCVTVRCERSHAFSWFQSTSSEEDVVSARMAILLYVSMCFNPRPPKRTLCQPECERWLPLPFLCFNPRPPKRTLCLGI